MLRDLAFRFDGALSAMWDWVFVVVTAAVAVHGIGYRDAQGRPAFGHLLFGCIALLFCLRVLFEDILQLL